MSIFNRFKRQELPSAKGGIDKRYLEVVLSQWIHSKEREEQLLADAYYDGDHDILRREKKVIGADGNLIAIDNVENARLVDNQYRKLVDQKTNYTLGNPITIATEDDDYLASLNKVFNRKAHRQLRSLVEYAVNGGIAWLYPYYNEQNEFKMAIFQSHEICPIWTDKSHTELKCVMRLYTEQEYRDNGTLEYAHYVDVFTMDGIDHYRYNGGSLIPSANYHTDYLYVGGQAFNWNKFPVIPFKYNSKEIPLIRNVKQLQDALNEILSDFKNNMSENPRTSILILKNYDGTNIGEFRQNLATYGVIKVTTVDGVQGGVETLKVDVNAQNYQAIMMQLKRAIIENGRGFDAKEERMDGDPNQMNIQSMYTDIDLDVNGMETEFQAGFEDLKWFIDQHLIHIGESDHSGTPVEFVFNRDIFINEDAKIDNCVKSVGIISNKTILSRHPYVTNVEREMQLIEEDKKAEMDEMMQMTAFQNQQSSGDD